MPDEPLKLPHEESVSTPPLPVTPQPADPPAGRNPGKGINLAQPGTGPAIKRAKRGVQQRVPVSELPPGHPPYPTKRYFQASKRGVRKRALIAFGLSALGLLLVATQSPAGSLGFWLCIFGMGQGRIVRPRLLDKAIRGKGLARAAFWLGLIGVFWAIYQGLMWYAANPDRVGG